MGHARSKAVVPAEVRRSPTRHQLLENPLLVRWSRRRFACFTLCASHCQPMADCRLQRHGAKVLLNPPEKEKGRFENRPFLKG
jgi:hypothetical protein